MKRVRCKAPYFREPSNTRDVHKRFCNVNYTQSKETIDGEGRMHWRKEARRGWQFDDKSKSRRRNKYQKKEQLFPFAVQSITLIECLLSGQFTVHWTYFNVAPNKCYALFVLVCYIINLSGSENETAKIYVTNVYIINKFYYEKLEPLILLKKSKLQFQVFNGAVSMTRD